MDAKEMGRRLKAARLAKKMTQSEVVGDFITRNMLSQIESGVATPSIKTLEYLADVLDISMASLLPQSGAYSTEADRIVKAKKAIEDGDHSAAIELLEYDCEVFGDEANALRSIAYLAAANAAAEAGELQRAVDCAKQAHEYAGLGIYENSDRAEESMKLMNRSAKMLSDYYAALITETDGSKN